VIKEEKNCEEQKASCGLTPSCARTTRSAGGGKKRGLRLLGLRQKGKKEGTVHEHGKISFARKGTRKRRGAPSCKDSFMGIARRKKLGKILGGYTQGPLLVNKNDYGQENRW